MMRRLFLPIGFLLLCLAAATPARAADLPALRVGRVAAIEGSIALRPAGGEWTDSAVNDPVAGGMSARTGPRSRALLRIGAEPIAMAAGTELDFVALDASNTQIVLRRGRVAVLPLSSDPARNIEVDLSRGGVWLAAPGTYDIAAGDEHTPLRVAVLDGRARLAGNGFDTAVAAGSAAVLNGPLPVAASLDEAAADDFIAWSRRQIDDESDVQARHCVSPEMTGYETLDANGSWEAVDGYGMAWFPRDLPPDWAPYRDGHWRSVAPWGWTWIDDMPWGFATSHYGRWASIPGPDAATERWAWVPGERVAEPAYAPALVAFLGTPGVGLSYPDSGGPAVAWFPLAPGEAYWPTYTVDIDTVRRINQGVVANLAPLRAGTGGEPPLAVVDGGYRNRRSASVVPRAVFVGGRPVAPALIRLPDERLDNAPLLAGSPQIPPPMPRPAIVASVPAPAARPVIAAAPQIAAATQVIRRLRQLRNRPNGARPAVVDRQLQARPRPVLAVAGRWRAPARLSRPHVAAAAARTVRPRVHLAAVRRAVVR